MERNLTIASALFCIVYGIFMYEIVMMNREANEAIWIKTSINWNAPIIPFKNSDLSEIYKIK